MTAFDKNKKLVIMYVLHDLVSRKKKLSAKSGINQMLMDLLKFLTQKAKRLTQVLQANFLNAL